MTEKTMEKNSGGLSARSYQCPGRDRHRARSSSAGFRGKRLVETAISNIRDFLGFEIQEVPLFQIAAPTPECKARLIYCGTSKSSSKIVVYGGDNVTRVNVNHEMYHLAEEGFPGRTRSRSISPHIA